MAEQGHGSKKPKKSHHDRNDHAVKKIDDLPDHVLFHVLSFLDAKSLGRTSVLCKRWRTLWKDTPALNFYCSDRPSVREHVEKLLLSLSSDRKKSLRTLRLTRSWFNCPSVIPGFSSLTTLELADCSFRASIPNPATSITTTRPAILLPFADLPSLKCLKLIDCSANGLVIVSLPHVLDLEIRDQNLYVLGIEQLLAPKLESFTFSKRAENLVYPSAQREVCYSLPSLNHATIRLTWEEPDTHYLIARNERRQCAFMTILRGLRNAKSLDLDFAKQHESWKAPWTYLNVLLNKIKSLVTNNRTSPFTALKTLRIRYPRDLPLHGYQVIYYRFEDGGYVEEKSVTCSLD